MAWRGMFGKLHTQFDDITLPALKANQTEEADWSFVAISTAWQTYILATGTIQTLEMQFNKSMNRRHFH